MSAFHCPRCTQGLRFERMGHLRRWVCPDDHGELLTVGSVRQLLAPERFKAWWIDAWAAQARGLPCGSCGRLSVSVLHQTPDGLLEVDLCKPCHFVWFDTGERVQLGPPPPPTPTAGQEIADLPHEARDALVQMKMEQIPTDVLTGESADDLNAAELGWRAMLGVPSEVDAPPVRRIPWLSWLFVATTAIGAVLSIVGGDELTLTWGSVLDTPLRLGGLPFLTGAMLQVNPMHALGIIWVGLVLADNVEELLGPTLLVCMVVIAQALTLGLHWLMVGIPGEPVVGAAGPAMAIATFYALRFPMVRLAWWSQGRWHSYNARWVVLVLGVLLTLLHVSDGYATATWLGPGVGAMVGTAIWASVGRGLLSHPDGEALM